MKVDLSFIPEGLCPEGLVLAASKRLEYPYIRNSCLEHLSQDPLVKSRLEYRQNYIDLETELFKFALHLFESGDYGLAEKCFLYLNGIGSCDMRVEPYLIKIYRKTKNREMESWVKNKAILKQRYFNELNMKNSGRTVLKLRKRRNPGREAPL